MALAIFPMLFKKPPDITYTQMAIYIDEHVYTEDCDQQLIFEYLYHLARMLAVQTCSFRTEKDYDDFSVFFASGVFMRLTNPKQNRINPKTGEPKMKRVKSVLNYMKHTLYPRKVDFQQEFFAQVDVDVPEINSLKVPTYTFANQLAFNAEKLMSVEFDCCVGNIPETIKAFLKKIPYRYKSKEWNNIYISCLLTFLHSVTLPESVYRFFRDKKSISSDIETLCMNYSRQNDTVILYHLDESMRDYIYVLVRKIKSLIAKDLSDIVHFSLEGLDIQSQVIKMDLNSLSAKELDKARGI